MRTTRQDRWLSVGCQGVLAGVVLTAVGVGPGTPAASGSAHRADDGSAAVGMPTGEAVARSRTHERAIEVLLDAAQSPNAEIRANAVEALGASPSRLALIAGAALRDDSIGVRAVAAMAVGKAELREFADDVRPLTGDSSPFVQASAIGALSMLGESPDPTPLADMLLTAASTRVRAHAAFVLGEMGDRSAVRMLKEAARIRIPRSTAMEVRLFRLQVAEALVKLGDDDALQALRAALYPSRPEELEATALAVQILGTIGDRGAINELMLLSERRDEAGGGMPAEIRLAAAASIAQLGDRSGWFIAERHWKDASAGVRAQAAIVFGWTRGERNLQRLEAMLEDPDARVRVAAAAAVVRLASSPN
ncbi:MAG: HEAT repeat domain-containing protein [Phycisphaerales bacterium]|nr:MAG: HEAT repeat domain-containing protein [Phycisphaerales bacterium]